MTIGDVHSDKIGSGARFNDGKPQFHLIPLDALADCAKVFEYGAKKYAEWNWLKGMPWSAPYDSLMRHMDAFWCGEDIDPESGLPHLGHAMCNLVMLSVYAKRYRDGDDRPGYLLRVTNPQPPNQLDGGAKARPPENVNDAVARVINTYGRWKLTESAAAKYREENAK